MRRNLRGGVLKNIRRHRKGGKVYKYHRQTGARLPDLPETHPDFVAAWLKEESAAPTVGTPGSLDHEIAVYLRSAHYRDLSPDYARVIEKNLSEISQSYGHAPAAKVQTRHIEADLDRLPPHPANARLKAWRALAGHMKRRGIPDASAGISKRQAPRTDGHLPVTLDQMRAYRDRWALDSIQRRAGELLFWTGARVSDAVRLSASHVGTDGLLSYRQAKTKNIAHVPWTSPLPGWAADWQADRDAMHAALAHAGGFTFLETVQGKGRSKAGLSNLISDAFAEIGVDRSAHGFRKTRLTLIAEACGSTQAIMSWGGHVTLAEAEHYTRSAERRRILLGG